jgi:hypothetical protein
MTPLRARTIVDMAVWPKAKHRFEMTLRWLISPVNKAVDWRLEVV